MFHAILQYARLTGRLYAGGGAPTIVYSKERTGSVAVYNSLRVARIPAIATHYIDPAKIAEGKLSGSARWASRHVVLPQRRAKFITLVRNPIDNLLSTFARYEFVDKRRESGPSLAHSLELDCASLAGDFERVYLDQEHYLRELNWFDSELKVALGIDVFDHSFDKAAGTGRIVAGPFELLILRTELADEAKAAAIAEFLELSRLEMRDRPGAAEGAPGLAGDRSAYGVHYREFKRRVSIPQRHWDVIAGSKLARHFLSEDELETSRARWATKPNADESTRGRQPLIPSSAILTLGSSET